MKSAGKKRPGFLLAEALIALMISIMTINILHDAILILRTVPRLDHASELRQQITQRKLSDYFKDQIIDEIDLETHQLSFKRYNSTEQVWHYKKLAVDQRWSDRQFLRLYDANGGFEPILNDVQKVSFKRIKNLLLITICDSDNLTTEMYIHGIIFKQTTSHSLDQHAPDIHVSHDDDFVSQSGLPKKSGGISVIGSKIPSRDQDPKSTKYDN